MSNYYSANIRSVWSGDSYVELQGSYGVRMNVMTGRIHFVKIVGLQFQPNGREMHSKYSPFILNVKYFRIAGCKRK